MDDSSWQDALTPSAVPAEDGDSAVVTDADGNAILDFVTFADAEAQAKALGGTVVPSGVAFHVEKNG